MKFSQKIIDRIRGKILSVKLKNRAYGSLWTPIYDLGAISSREPEIYNKDGQKMRSYFIRDRIMAAIPQYMQSKYFLWDRYNVGYNTHFYSHNSMLETIGKPDKRYGIMFESESIVPKDYLIFEKHKGLEKDFDAVFTYSAKLLDKLPNAKFYPACCSSWYGIELGGGEIRPDAFKFKTKNISIMSSNKRLSIYQSLRADIAKKLKASGLADTFGNFDKSGMCAITTEELPSKLCDALADYRFSFAIENDITPYFFTEKITSCFAAMTIPVYLGASKIDEFFNPDGIIKIDINALSNIEKITAMCTAEEYERRLPAIIDNFNRVQKFLNANDYLYQTYLAKG